MWTALEYSLLLQPGETLKGETFPKCGFSADIVVFEYLETVFLAAELSPLIQWQGELFYVAL